MNENEAAASRHDACAEAQMMRRVPSSVPQAHFMHEVHFMSTGHFMFRTAEPFMQKRQ